MRRCVAVGMGCAMLLAGVAVASARGERELTNDYLIRRKASDLTIPLITNIQLAQRFVEAVSRKGLNDLMVKSWAMYGGDGVSPSCKEGFQVP